MEVRLLLLEGWSVTEKIQTEHIDSFVPLRKPDCKVRLYLFMELEHVPFLTSEANGFHVFNVVNSKFSLVDIVAGGCL